MTNLKQVAELAGVSASTVSRALNGKSYVNEATASNTFCRVASFT